MVLKTAEEVQGGRLVLFPIDGRRVVCLKAIRHGKDHVNHYLVPLDPWPADALTLVYVDFAAELHDCHDTFVLSLEPFEAGPDLALGSVVTNATGTYIKVQEPNKGILSLGYVDVASGEIRRRQERGIAGVYRLHVACIGTDPRS